LATNLGRQDRVPPTSFAIGLFIIIALAILPRMAVRCRCRQIRSQLDE